MIIALKPYPKYKDSGVLWLGEVPEQWEVRRLKSSVSHIVKQTNAKESNDLYIALEHVESWTGRLRKVNNDTEFDSQVKRFRAQDVLFGKLRPYLAKVVRPAQGGVCVGEFLVLRCKDAVSPAFLEVTLRSAPAIDLVNSSTYGAKMPRADWSFIGGMAFPFPPFPEQTAIVRFLDWADRRIRRVIRARQRRIKLLEEYKQALINQAVTGRIDVRTGKPYLKYKDSGVEWLGEVPEHWEVVRIKFVARLKSGESITAERIEENGVFPVYGGNGLRGFTSAYTHEGEFVLIGRQGALCGNINYASGRFWASEHAVVAHPLQDIAVRWFGELLRSMNLNQYSIAAAQPGLAVERIQNLPIPLPPIPEQCTIAEYLERQTASIDAAIAADRRAIDLLEEFRTRLIADVVTGKLDVREAAAKLPNEPDELELDNEIGATESDENGDTFGSETPETV